MSALALLARTPAQGPHGHRRALHAQRRRAKANRVRPAGPEHRDPSAAFATCYLLAAPAREDSVRRWRESCLADSGVGKVDGMLNSIGISLLLGAPWIVAIILMWSRAPRPDRVPPSMAERARERLWA